MNQRLTHFCSFTLLTLAVVTSSNAVTATICSAALVVLWQPTTPFLWVLRTVENCVDNNCSI